MFKNTRRFLVCLLVVIYMFTGCSYSQKENLLEKVPSTQNTEDSTEEICTEIELEENMLQTEMNTEENYQENTEEQTETEHTEDNIDTEISEKIDENETVSKEYYYYYDTNRDGVVTKDEITAYDKRFYASSPTTEGEEKALLAGYYEVIYLEDDWYGIMVKSVVVDNERISEYELAGDLLEKYLLKKGLAARSIKGGNLDRERYFVICYAEPIACSVDRGIFALATANFQDENFYELYGYKNVELICARYVQYDFYDGSIGTESDGDIVFNVEEILLICDYMGKKNPEEYLEHCPDPINEVFIQTNEEGTYVNYAFTVDENADYDLIKSLFNQAIARVEKEYPGCTYEYSYSRCGMGDYVEGRMCTYWVDVHIPVEDSTR